EVHGAPLEPCGDGGRCGQPAPQGADAHPVAPATGPAPAAAPALQHTAAAIAELIDLDKLTLAPGGDHYEAQLKDGRHAVLTLDPTLQAYAEKLLTEARAPRGAIVAMAPDGRILALAGRRSEVAPSKKSAGKSGTFDWRLATDVWA